MNHLNMKFGQLVDIAVGNVFRKHSAWFGGLGLNSNALFNFSDYRNKSKINYDKHDFLLFCRSTLRRSKKTT